MDKKFLHKVIDQLVYETEIDYEYMGGRIFISFLPSFFLFSIFLKSFSSYFPHFAKHCKGVYGLTYEETKYVWNEYRGTIKDKINNGQ